MNPAPEHTCRPACAACCIAASISSPIPGMPDGKPAGVTCIHLTEDLLCGIFGQPGRPRVCINFNFDPLVCGNSRGDALRILYELSQ